jgi:hexosaminidase
VSVIAVEGDPFVLRDGVRVVAAGGTTSVTTATLVAERIGRATGFPVAVVQEPDHGRSAVVLRLAERGEVGVPDDLPDELAAEAYRLEVRADRVDVVATSGVGLVRGAVTFDQLATVHNDTFRWLPCTVVDHPRFAWRGLTVDVARSFLDLDALRQVLDVMLLYKLSVLHLHLTDDQGWRLQLAARPELAARSGATAVEGGLTGTYSRQDWDELVAFAAVRGITVVPEVDVPGHVNAALHAVPALNPSGRPAPEYSGVEVGFSALDPGLPETSRFLRDVFGELASMTSGPWVHVGGDEVQTLDADAYRALVRAAADRVRAGGKHVVAWQEAATALAGPDVVLQYWDQRSGRDEMVAAAAAGARVVLSPAPHAYLDMKYDADSRLGLEWAGHIGLRDAYDWEPLDVLPVPAAQVAGVGAAVWSETVRGVGDLFWLLLPRLAAVAEVAWSAPERRSWESFAARLPVHGRWWVGDGLPWFAAPGVAWEPADGS